MRNKAVVCHPRWNHSCLTSSFLWYQLMPYSWISPFFAMPCRLWRRILISSLSMTYNMCRNHNVFPLYEHIPKPPCSALLFVHPCSVLFYSSCILNTKETPPYQGSVELTHQGPQKNPLNSKGSPKIPHVTNGTETLTPERALGSHHPTSSPPGLPGKPSGLL